MALRDVYTNDKITSEELKLAETGSYLRVYPSYRSQVNQMNHVVDKKYCTIKKRPESTRWVRSSG